MNYLQWDEKTITDFSDQNVNSLYDRGYVFTRIGRGVMQQTRSVRIALPQFKLSSENKRILKKVADVQMNVQKVPLSSYDFKIGKLAKDFYDSRFGPGIMSAQKVKEMLTDATKSNFNCLLTFSLAGKTIGYAICYENAEIIHYSYPFYNQNESPADMGLGMMTKAIEWAAAGGKKYVYLGSLQRPGDVYKLQFSGLEWFDGKEWKVDLEEVKKILASGKIENNER